MLAGVALAIAPLACNGNADKPAPAGRQESTAAVTDRTVPTVTVYKTPSCECCVSWIDHLRANSFRVVAMDTSAAELDRLKRAHGVPQALRSCHTAFVNGYVVEGHVPAADIRRMLATSPAVVGLAVPGMPAGSPGMETGSVDPYEVLAIGTNGRSTVYARYSR